MVDNLVVWYGRPIPLNRIAESPKQEKSHKTHETWGLSETACARVHLAETWSPWDQHTLARDAPLNPNLLPQYHSPKVLQVNTSQDGIVVAPTNLAEAPDLSCAQKKGIERVANTIGPKFVLRPQVCEFFKPALIRMRESSAEFISVKIQPSKTSFDYCSGTTLARVQVSFFVDPCHLLSILSYPTVSLHLYCLVTTIYPYPKGSGS